MVSPRVPVGHPVAESPLMSRKDGLGPITAPSGTPLYAAARDRLRAAIRSGSYSPGDRLPSTQEISRILKVSLVTSHRALQELEAAGEVERVQGRGTFVAKNDGNLDRQLRLSLVLQPEASLADYYHGQVLEGMHRAAREGNCELSITQGSQREKKRTPDGYLLFNPLDSQVNDLRGLISSGTPVMIAGARHDALPWIDVDNVDLINQAVEHAVSLGHRKIMFIGGADELSNSRDRRRGFLEACERLKVAESNRSDVNASSWQLSDQERARVSRQLSGNDRPTAVVAGGYHLALGVYRIAATLSLDIPDDLTVIGVDDPPSAVHLDPPMTTLQQPLIELGHNAVHHLVEAIRHRESLPSQQTLRAKLAIRGSSATA